MTSKRPSLQIGHACASGRAGSAPSSEGRKGHGRSREQSAALLQLV